MHNLPIENDSKSEDKTRELTGGSIVFIESSLGIDKGKKDKEISKSDEYTLENLITSYRNTYEKNKSDEVTLYLWGSALSTLNRYDEAITKFKEAIAINSDYYDVYLSWADTLSKMNRYDESSRFYEKASKIVAGDADLYFKWGTALYQISNFEEAEKKFKISIELNPTNASYYLNLSSVLYMQKKFKKSYEVLLYAQKLNPDNPEIYTNQANCLIKFREEKKAKKVLEKALELDSKNPKSLITLANIHYMLEEFEDAVIYYKKSLQYIEGNPYLFNNVGVSYYKINSLDTAETYLKKALASAGDKLIIDIYANLANVYLDKKQYELAIECLEAYSEANNYNLQSTSRLAKAYTYSDKINKAVDLYFNILNKVNYKNINIKNINENYNIDIIDILKSTEECLNYLLKNKNGKTNINEIIKYYTFLAEIYYKIGKKDEAYRLVKKADDFSVDNPNLMLLMGKIYFYNNETEKAIEYLDKSLPKVKPDDIELYIDYTDYLISKDLHDKALKIISIFESISPESSIIPILYGKIFINKKEYKKAESYLNKAIKIDPQNLQPKMELGKLYFYQNNINKALDILKVASENSSNPEAYYYLAMIYEKMDRDKLAIQSYKRAITINDKDIRYIKGLVEIFYKNEDYQDIIDLLKNRIDSLSQEEIILLTNSYIKQNSYDNARKTIELLEIIKINDPEILYLYGYVHYKLNLYDKAITYLNKSLNIDLNFKKSIETLADVYFDKEQYEDAYLKYDKLINIEDNSIIENNPSIIKKYAICLYNIEKYEDAEKYLQLVLKKLRVDYEVYYYLGISQIKNSKYEQALENLLTSTELKTNFVKGFLELGKLFTIMESYNEAVAIFEKASEFQSYNKIKIEESALNCREYWSQALIELKSYKKAELILQTILEDSPVRISSLLVYAKLLSESGKIDEAIKRYKKAINIEPKSYEANFGLAEEYLQEKNYLKASQYYQNCFQIREDDILSLYKYSLCMYQLSSYEGAIPCIKRILEIDDSHKESVLILGKIYLADFKLSEAIKYLESYNNLVEKNAESIFLLGLSYYLARNYEKSLQTLFNLNDIKFNNYISYYLIGMSYYSLNDYDKAIEFIEKSVALDETFSQGYHYLGVLHFENHNYEKALENFNNSQSINSLTIEGLFYKTCCYVNLKLIKKASQEINRLVENFESDDKILIVAGLINIIDNQPQTASYMLKKAHSINPNSPNLTYYFSIINRLENNINEAEKYLLKEYNNKKDNIKIILELALLQIEKEDFAQATQYLKLCLEKDPNNFEAYLNLGIISVKAQNYDTAKSYLEKALIIKPDDEDALFNSAIANFNLKRYENADELFQKSLSFSVGEIEYLILYYIGLCKYKEGNNSLAREYFAQSIKNNSNYFQSLFMYGKICFELKIPDEGYRYYQRASDINSQSYELHIEWGKRLFEDKLYDEALEILDIAKKINSKNKEPYIISSEIYELRNDKDKALSEYKSILNINNNNFDIMVKFANTLYHVGEFEQSVIAYEKALKLREPGKELSIQYIQALIKSKNYEKAETKLIDLIKNVSQNGVEYELLGICQTNLGKLDKALDSFKTAENNNKISPNMLSNWGFCLYKSNRYKEALEKFNTLIEISKATDDDYFYAGECALNMDNYYQASSFFMDLILSSPNYMKAYIPLAKSLIKSEKKEEAIEILERAEKSDPNNYEIFIYWGEVYQELGFLNKALDKYNKALNIDKDNPIPHLYCAKIYDALGNYSEAEKEYRKYLLSEPNSIEPLKGLAKILIKNKNFKEAIGIIKHALSLNKNDFTLINQLAVSYHMTNQLGYAETFFDKAYNLNQASLDINLNYANLLFDIEKYDSAKAKLEFVISHEKNNNQALLKLGIISYFNNDFVKAMEYLLDAKTNGENSIQVYSYLGKCEYKQKNYKEAYKYLNNAINMDVDEYSIFRIAGECAYYIGDFQKAYELYQKAYIKAEDKNDIIKEWVTQLIYIEDYINAENIISRIDLNKINDVELHKYKGEILYKLNEKDKALPYLLSVHEKKKEDLDIIVLISKTYLELGLYDEALTYLNQSLKIDNRNTEILNTLVKVYLQTKDLEKAIEYSEILLSINPTDNKAKIAYGECLLMKGDKEKAIKYLEDAVNKEPTKDSLIRLSEIYIESNKLKEATELIKNNLDSYSNDYEIFLLNGKILYKQKRYEKAIENFQKSFGLNNKAIQPILNLARTYSAIGSYDNAFDYYQKAIDIEPENINIYNNWADILYESMSYKEALKIVDKAILFQPDNKEALEIKAKIYYELNMYEEAYRIYLTLNPDSNSSTLLLEKYALTLKYLEMYQDAIKIFKIIERRNQFNTQIILEYLKTLMIIGDIDKVIELSNTEWIKNTVDARIKHILGNVYFEIEDYIEAEKHYNYAIKSNLIDNEIFYKLGIVLYNLKKYREAKQIIERAINQNHNDYRYYYYLARCNNKMGIPIDAIEDYKKCIDLNPEYYKAYFEIGIILFSLSKYEEGHNYFEKAESLNSNDILLYKEWAQNLIKIKKYEIALDKIEHALKIDEDDLNLLDYKAYVLMILNQYNDAIGIYSKLYQKDNLKKDFYIIKISEALYEMGEYEESYKRLSQIKEKPDDDYLFVSLLGKVALALNYNSIARKYLEKSIYLNPDNALLYRYYGESLIKLGDYDKAIEILKKASIIEDSPIIRYMLGKCYYHSNNYEEALWAFEFYISINDTDLEALHFYSMSLIRLKQKENAIQVLNKLTEIKPDYKDSVLLLANCYYETGRNRDCLRIFEKYEKECQSYRFYFEWANKLKTLGEFEKAIDKYSQCERINTDNLIASFRKGDLLIDIEQLEEAEELFNNILKSHPDDYSANLKYATSLYKQNKIEHAIHYFEKCYKIKPLNYELLMEYGNASIKNKNYEKAKELYKNASELDNNKPEPNVSIGKIYIKEGDIDKAISYFKIALRIDHNYESAYIEWGNALYISKSFEEAVVKYMKALQQNPNNSELYKAIAKSYFNIQKYDEAVKYIESAIIYHYDNELKYLLGVCYIQLEKVNQAIEIFEELKSDKKYEYEARKKLISLFYKIKELEKTYNEYNIIINNYRCNEKIYINYAEILMENHKYQEAYNILKPKSKEKIYPKINILLSKCSIELFDINQAINLLKKNIEHNPEDLDSIDLLVEILISENLYDEAEKILNDLSNKYNEEYRVVYRKAVLYYEKNKINDAKIFAKRALDKNKNNYNVYNLLGNIELKEKDYHKALMNFQKAQLINPEDIISSYESALIYYKIRDYKKANDKLQETVLKYKQALQFQKSKIDLVETHCLLGSIYNEWEEPDRALYEFEFAKDIVLENGDSESSNLFYIEHMIKLIKKHKTRKENHNDNYYIDSNTVDLQDYNNYLEEKDNERNNVNNNVSNEKDTLKNSKDIDNWNFEDVFIRIDEFLESNRKILNDNDFDLLEKKVKDFTNIIINFDKSLSRIDLIDSIKEQLSKNTIMSDIIWNNELSQEIYYNKNRFSYGMKLIIDVIKNIENDKSLLLVNAISDDFSNEINFKLLPSDETNHIYNDDDLLYNINLEMAKILFEDIPALINIEKSSEEYNINIILAKQ